MIYTKFRPPYFSSGQEFIDAWVANTLPAFNSLKNKLKLLYIFVLILIKAPNVFGDNNLYLQATTQVAATNFDYVSTSYYNSSIEGFYNFESSPFIIGG